MVLSIISCFTLLQKRLNGLSFFMEISRSSSPSYISFCRHFDSAIKQPEQDLRSSSGGKPALVTRKMSPVPSFSLFSPNSRDWLCALSFFHQLYSLHIIIIGIIVGITVILLLINAQRVDVWREAVFASFLSGNRKK